MSTASDKNPLELSDEEFLNLNGPPEAVSEEETPAAGENPEPEPEPAPAETENAPAGEETVSGESGADTVSGDAGQDTLGSETKDSQVGASGQDTISGASGQDTVNGADTQSKPEGESGDKVQGGEPPDYEAVYKRLMSPVKANGKLIELKSPEEAIQLMQMGANYTQKMQQIAPHRRVLTMLQNNGLLDESKLSFLIDLDKKNPEAIKKLIKDAGIDPMGIDTDVDPAYQEGSHRVTDEEVSFKQSLEDLGSTPEGKETLQTINARWDDASKELLWKYPQTLALIHEQREAGIYDRIASEVDRRRTLGSIQQGIPFLEAYQLVGKELAEAKAFDDLRKPTDNAPSGGSADQSGQTDKPQAPTPVATRVATPKASAANGDAASAAAHTRATPKKVQEFVNPLAMSDDDFLKQMEGRL